MRIPWRILRSVFLFLVFLEIYFWIGSWVTQVGQYWGNVQQARQKNVYRILCIGESTTLVGGKDSYPSQLENILNQTGGGMQFQVINQGMAGVSTTTISQQLPQWLQRYRPDMVIAMIGILDPMQNQKQDTPQSLPAFVEKIKLYQLFKKLEQKAVVGLKEYVQRQERQIHPPVKENKVFTTEYDMFNDAMVQQPDDQKKLYFLINLVKADGRMDVAEVLYEKFLQNNKNDVINRWVIKQYGNLLVQRGEYDKFVRVMEYIPYDSWLFDWIKGYCHGEDHMERVRQTIERMVTQERVDPLVYGYVSACYEEGGHKDLADIYQDKMGLESSYYAPLTRRNYIAIKDILLSQDIQPVFVQYPMRNIRPLLSIFDNDPDRGKIIFVDNGPVFHEGVRQKSYEFYFLDKMSGDTGHATPEGNHLLAGNIAKAILGRIFLNNRVKSF